MNCFYKPKPKFVICSNINDDYLLAKYQKQCLNSLVASSNHASVVDFPRRVQNYSSTVTGNIFKVTSRNDSIYIEPMMDGLSDHGTKLLVIKKCKIDSKLSQLQETCWTYK
jgi:hypothetical protein